MAARQRLGDRSEQGDPQSDALVAHALDEVEVECGLRPTG